MASEKEPAVLIEEMAKRCTARTAAHSMRAQRAQSQANVLLLLGATIAAVGSALAGFLSNQQLRKVTSVAGALGAILSVVPKTLEQPEVIRELHRNASAHEHAASKIVHQLGFVTAPQEKASLQRYVIRRLVDCEKDIPPPHVPDYVYTEKFSDETAVDRKE